MEQPIVVVSSNNNPDYLFFLPIVEWCWNQLGWKTAMMLTADVDVNKIGKHKVFSDTIMIQLPEIEGIRPETMAQGGRLYACNYLPKDTLVMTSDADMIPLSNFLKPNRDEITEFGHDLTWFNFFPMCYIAMKTEKWQKIMDLSYDTKRDFERDAKANGRPYATEWERWWDFDWEHITQKLKESGEPITHVNRGQVQCAGATLAKGRIDRYAYPKAWDEALQQPERMDCHCINAAYSDERWGRLFALMLECFGEDARWMEKYKNDFKLDYAK